MVEGFEFSFVCCVSIILASVEGRLVGDYTSKYTPLRCYCCFSSRT
jgi:hypothetical protein